MMGSGVQREKEITGKKEKEMLCQYFYAEEHDCVFDWDRIEDNIFLARQGMRHMQDHGTLGERPAQWA